MPSARPARDIALFGGSFDPPHCAHVMAISYVLTCTPCTQAWVLPVFHHAFDKDSAPFQHRLAMCRAAFAPFGRRVRVTGLESRLPGPSYTVQTLRYLVRRHPDTRFHLVIGTDILAESSRWRDFDEVARLARLLVLARGQPDPRAVGPVFPPVSSSAIRADIAAGRDPSALVPAAVLDLVHRLGLYRAGGPG